MTTIIGGASQNTGNEYTTECLTVATAGDKGTGGRVVKLNPTTNQLQRITAKLDKPYGIVVAQIGLIGTYSLSQTVCVRGRNIYVELADGVVAILAGDSAYIVDDGRVTNVEGQQDTGAYIGTFTSSVIFTVAGTPNKNVGLVRIG